MKIIHGDVNLKGLYLEELPEFLNGVDIIGFFDCSHNKLKSLKNAPKSVEKFFDCSYNQLRTLESCPELVNGFSFLCQHNQLLTLEGCPEVIRGHFICFDNHLQSLDGAPRYVGKNFWCKFNPGQFTIKDVRAVCQVDGGY